MKKILIFTLLILANILIANDIIKVETIQKPNPLYSYRSDPNEYFTSRYSTYLKITSLINKLEITKVTTNRGKCKLADKRKILNYADSLELYMDRECANNILEIEIYTNEGDFTFS